MRFDFRKIRSSSEKWAAWEQGEREERYLITFSGQMPANLHFFLKIHPSLGTHFLGVGGEAKLTLARVRHSGGEID